MKIALRRQALEHDRIAAQRAAHALELPPLPSLYHIVLVNDKMGTKEYMTRYAMPHGDCVRVRDKYTPTQREWLRHVIEPLYKFTPHGVGEQVAYART